MKKYIFKLMAFTFILTACFSSCRKSYPACDVKKPLTDLPWLKELVDKYEKGTKEPRVVIYQCTYRDGICFLLDFSVDCYDGGYSLINCEGNLLCSVYAGYDASSCVEYKIDFKNKKFIWKSKKR